MPTLGSPQAATKRTAVSRLAQKCVGSAEFQGEADAKTRRPLARLSQRNHGPFQGRRLNSLDEIGDQQHGANLETLAEFEPTAVVVEMSLALLALRQQQSALIRRGGQPNSSIGEQSLGVRRGMCFEVLFELCEPDLQGRKAAAGAGFDVVQE